jgi:hypothetical protein
MWESVDSSMIELDQAALDYSNDLVAQQTSSLYCPRANLISESSIDVRMNEEQMLHLVLP